MAELNLQEAPARKKRRLGVKLPASLAQQDNWISDFNLEGRIRTSQYEVGDGATSRVYMGNLDGITVAVKQLKCYSPRLASALIHAYDQLFNLKHDNIVQVLGICPNSGQIIMEYCHRVLDNCTLRTLGDLLLHYGNHLPDELRIMALSDVAEGLQYLHCNDLVHGDVKPHNVLVTGSGQEFLFKITDYACYKYKNASQFSAQSSSLKQLMTPGYLAPELISDVGNYLDPTKASDIYSFSILSYEVAFTCEPWPSVSMKLIDSVRKGYRPVIPSNASKFVSSLIQDCWKHDSAARPSALQVSLLLQDYLELSSTPEVFVTNASAESANHGNPLTCISSGVTVGHTRSNNVTSTNDLITSESRLDRSVSARITGTQTLEDLPMDSDFNEPNSLNATQGCEVPQQSHDNVNNLDNPSESTPITSHTRLPGSAEEPISLESSIVQDLTSGCASVANNNPSVTASQTYCSKDIQGFANASTVSQGNNLLNSIELLSDNMKKVKTTLNVQELKEFQVQCINAVQQGNDVILVQPTGSGKSLCFTFPALLNPGKVSIVIEPVVAIINNQVEALQKKGIDAVALGRAAGNKKSSNYQRVFQSSNVPNLAFCTPEYLFGAPTNATFSGSCGQFHSLLAIQNNVSMVTINEAHKIFDRMPSYRPAFDDMKQLRELSCPIVAMSATLTSGQVDTLKQEYIRSDRCLVITKGVHRQNLQLRIQRYKRRKQHNFEEGVVLDDDDSDKENEPDSTVSAGSDSTFSAGTSMWVDSINKIKPLFKDHSTVLYLDFVKDVEEVTNILSQGNAKVGEYTGQMTVDDQKVADKRFLHGETSILVATESFELGVDNPNISQVIRIGCPRNLGVFLQEVGRAGRKPDSIAQGLLLFNEYIDDKRLGQWLKSALDSTVEDTAVEAVKSRILGTYSQAWRFIYSIYDGKCLSQALAFFYCGVNDTDPPTCFVANNPLCSVCQRSEEICETSIDIKELLLVLLQAIKELCTAGLPGVTKTLLFSVLLKINEKYVQTFEALTDILDSEDTCWGSGISVNGTAMSQSAWHKVLYVGVHRSLVDLNFAFRPYENHYEVHRKYVLSSVGEEFLQAPFTVMSVDPHTCIIDRILGVTQRVSKRCNKSRGKQLKPRIVAALEECHVEGTIEDIKFIGFGCENDTCIFFKDCFSLPNATKDPHFLLECIQLSRTRAGIKELSVVIDGVTANLMCNRSYCSGAKMCAAENCTYTVSTKQRVNRCQEHPKMGLLQSGPCSCYIAYFYPPNMMEDGRRWFVVINAENTTAGNLHNHLMPSEWKLPPKLVNDIATTTKKNIQITPKEVQKGAGMDYRPMQVSLAAANIDRIRAVVKKARRDVDKVDHDRVNPFAIIASFPSIKERVDQSTSELVQGIDDMIGTYQLDGDDTYSFGRDRQYAWFQAPFQAYHWANSEVLFVDIDYTGCHHFPYLLNVVCKNSILKQYMACGRVLLNCQDGTSIGKALSGLECNVKALHKEYNITRDHKEILLDFDEAESNAFSETFGKEINNILQGCSVHFFRSAMRVAKLVNLSTSSQGYHIFMSVAKRIPYEHSSETVMNAFVVLCGSKSFEIFSAQLPPDLRSLKACNVDTSKWRETQAWVDWWTRPQILKKLCGAYSSPSVEDWEDLPGTNNPVESINRQSTPENTKSVSLKPLIEHFYLEDRRIAIMQLASAANVTVTYQTNQRKRRRRPAKPPEKKTSLCQVPKGSKAIGIRVNVEFYEGEEEGDCQTTKWYKGTIIAYSKRGHVVTFEGYGPEHNETIRHLKKSIEKGEVRLCN